MTQDEDSKHEAEKIPTCSKPNTIVSIYHRRSNDYIKQTDKSLNKNYSLFTKTNDAPRYAGGMSEGPFYKKNSREDGQPKIYYLAAHSIQEYYAFEIMQYADFITPKARLIPVEVGGGMLVAASNLDGYIPMVGIRDDLLLDDDPECSDIRKLFERYKLNFEAQTIFDKIENKNYKVHGNLFSSYLLAELIYTWQDFDPGGTNLGVLLRGGRFYGAAIDKDNVNLTCAEMYSSNNDKLYQSCTKDQEIAVLYKVHEGLKEKDDKLCDFQRIFLNKRTENTPALKSIREKLCEGFINRATILLSHKGYSKPDSFEPFLARENIRKEIAMNVVSRLQLLPSHIDKNDLLQLIISDLRGPFYKDYFEERRNSKENIVSEKDIQNEQLLNALAKDFSDELNISFEDQHFYTPGFF